VHYSLELGISIRVNRVIRGIRVLLWDDCIRKENISDGQGYTGVWMG
jgi:hypothetical protein